LLNSICNSTGTNKQKKSDVRARNRSKFIVHVVNSACGLTVRLPEVVCHVLFVLKVPVDGCPVRLIEEGELAFVCHMGSLHRRQDSCLHFPRPHHGRFVTSSYRYDKCRVVQSSSAGWGRGQLSEDVGVQHR